MMKVTIDGRDYKATTAVALIEAIKGMNWAATEKTDAEGYIKIQADTYKMMVGRKMTLPRGDTEARAVAMFEAIGEVGAWKFERDE